MNDKERASALEKAIRDGGFYSEEGIWNSILVLPNDNIIYRGRVETLIIKDKKYVFVKRHENKYRIPGGGFEKNIPNMDQAVNECREEARINVKNIMSTGITYKEYAKTPKWALKNPVHWNGKFIEVYVAEYDSMYRGRIDPHDVDSDIATGKFILIEDALKFFNQHHKKAIQDWLENQRQKIDDYGNKEKPVTESANKTKVFFLSDKNFDNQTLEPRVPSNFFTRKGYEDPTTPRICFCGTIDGCLTAIARNIENQDFYVHKPVGDINLYECTPDDVPDTVITHEYWSKEPTTMKCVGKIRVGQTKGEPIKFKYGDVNEGELNKWEWHWLDKPSRTIVKEYTGNYEPLFTSYNITYNNIVSIGFGNPNVIREEDAINIFESMVHHGVKKSVIKERNPLYRYIDLWDDVFKNQSVVYEGANTIDIQNLLNWLNNVNNSISKCITTLHTLVKSANRMPEKDLIKSVISNKKFINAHLMNIRSNIQRHIAFIDYINKTRLDLIGYDNQLRKYKNSFKTYDKAIEKIAEIYEPIERNIGSKNVHYGIASVHLSELLASLEITNKTILKLLESLYIFENDVMPTKSIADLLA